MYSTGGGTAIRVSQVARAPSVARVVWAAFSKTPLTLRNNLVRTLSFLFRLRADVAPLAVDIPPCFRGHRGLGKALVPRTRISLLRDRVRTAKGNERMGNG